MRGVFIVLVVVAAIAGPCAAGASNGDQALCQAAKGDEAIPACTRMIESGPADQLAAVHYRRGKAYLAIYQRPDAVADFTRAIELKPDFAEAYLARADANRFNNHDKERLARVRADYDKAIELRPDYFEAHHFRGTFHDWLKDHALALADYDTALKLKPGDVPTLHMRARLHQHLGNYERALADCNELIRLDPWVNRYADRAGVHLALGDYDRANADYDEVARRKPGDLSAHSGRAAVYERTGDYPRALAEYDEAIPIAPNVVALYSARAWVYFRMGRLAEGLAEVDRILAAGWTTSAHTYNTRGHILEALGRRGEAVVDLQKALSLDPG